MNKNEKIKVSIVIPCLNEEQVIADVITSCKAGLLTTGIHGQILIVDSGNDKSAEIAQSLGAEVIKVPKSGLGQAYLDSIPQIKGEFVVMGDADGTYDFKEIKRFTDKLSDGYEFVMGTRLKGKIEVNAIPKLHRYFGTPLTTWILNRLFNLNFSDIHCGLRALTKDALVKIDLKSKSWEYASEMVIKAGLLKLKSTEVPIHFYKDRNGRLSHHKRSGWFSPWYAGWINLKIMFLYAPNFIFYVPGFVMTVVGLLILFFSTLGIIYTFQFHFALLGFVFVTTGFLVLQLGVLSKRFSDLSKYYQDKLTLFLKDKFTYSKGMITGLSLLTVGLLFSCFLLFIWVKSNYMLEEISIYGITGLTLITIGFQVIFFTFIYEVFKLAEDEK